jgi:predicted DNA-binding transcriptional regulator AlpA
MPEVFISDQDLAARYCVARPTIWRWHRQQPDFPRVVKLSPGCARWKLSEIEEWEASRAKVVV